MTDEIKKRIEQVQKGKVPEGYKREKGKIIPATWSGKKLGDILQKVGKRVTVEDDVYYTQIGIRSHGKGLFYKKPVSGTELGNKSVFWIEKDCFIVNIVFAWEQAIGKTTENEVGMIGSHRFPMYRAIPHEVSLDYLLCFFNTKRGKDVLAAASPGGAGRNKTLGQKEFANSKIYLPPIYEQKKIADILTYCDKVIELKRQMIAEECKQKKWLANKFFKLSKSHTQALGNLCHVTMGQSPDSKSYNSFHKGLPLIQGNADIENRISNPKSYTTEPTKTCEINDIILSVRAPVGMVARSSMKACIGRGVCAITPKIDSEYIYQFLLYFEDKWANISQGSTFAAVSGDEIRKIVVPISGDMNYVADILFTADRKIELLEQEMEQWQLKKKSLMQLLLTGIVGV